MKHITSSLRTNDLVINWHLTEACNYACRYCYAKWHQNPRARELYRDPAASRTLLEELASFFSPDNHHNPLSHPVKRAARAAIAA